MIITNRDVVYLCVMCRRARVKADISEEIISTKKYGHLTPCLFYSYLYMERVETFNYITKGRMLFQQFVVDIN